jgi:hypothetical protein
MNKNVMARALPLVASVLGKKYGVKVEIGGDAAFTDGNTIHLPTLPLDSDEKFRCLASSYIDHEAAHIRETDFEVLKDKSLTPLMKHIWNIFEDWRVERAISKRFPGCRTNLNWLIVYHFAKPMKKQADIAMQILNYLLLAVRAWDVPEVESNRDKVGKQVENVFPNLYANLNKLLDELKINCANSADCLRYAKRAVALLEAEVQNINTKMETEKQAENGGTKTKSTSGSETQNNHAQSLEKILNADASDLPNDFAEVTAGELKDAIPKNIMDGLEVATEAPKKVCPLPEDAVSEVKRASAALHARLYSLLQTTTLVRRTPSRRGKLDTNRLYKLSHSPKIFLRNGEKQGISTAVHLLLDVSSSMRSRIELATQACFAIADSLHKINGVSVSVTAFPADIIINPANPISTRCTVSPLLKPGQKLHSCFKLKPSGSTPMGPAIWWTLQQLHAQAENRKIILILTDGKPDSVENTLKAIEYGTQLGFEFYGIGMDNAYITQLLPNRSEYISDLNELAPTLFRVLQNALISRG